MSIQIAIRIPPALAAELDGLVASRRFETRAEAVRAAIEQLLEAERRADLGRRIVEGYVRVPEEDAEVRAAEEAAARAAEEDW